MIFPIKVEASLFSGASQVLKPLKRRLLVSLLEEIAVELNLECQTCSGDWGVLLTHPESKKTQFIWGYSFGLNNQATAKFCDDKAMLSDVLAIKGIPHVAHHIYLSSAHPEYTPSSGSMIPLFLFADKFNNQIVLKPKDGTDGNGVMHCQNRRDIENAAMKLWSAHYGLVACAYEEMVHEYRAICLDGVVKLVYTKVRPSLVGDGYSTVGMLLIKKLTAHPELLDATKQVDHFSQLNLTHVLKAGETCPIIWKHNLGCGAHVSLDIDPVVKPKIEALALTTVAAINARFVSVDIVQVVAQSHLAMDDRFAIKDEQTHITYDLKVLEVNSGVMMEKVIDFIPQGKQIAKAIYKEAVIKVIATL